MARWTANPRDFAAAIADGRSLAPFIAKLNRIRREHPALQQLRDLRFHSVDNDQLIAFSKRDPDTGDTVLVVVTVDPHETQEATVTLALDALGMTWDAGMTVRDLLTGAEYPWGERNYVRLDPHAQPAHIFVVEPNG